MAFDQPDRALPKECRAAVGGGIRFACCCTPASAAAVVFARGFFNVVRGAPTGTRASCERPAANSNCAGDERRGTEVKEMHE